MKPLRFTGGERSAALPGVGRDAATAFGLAAVRFTGTALAGMRATLGDGPEYAALP